MKLAISIAIRRFSLYSNQIHVIFNAFKCHSMYEKRSWHFILPQQCGRERFPSSFKRMPTEIDIWLIVTIAINNINFSISSTSWLTPTKCSHYIDRAVCRSTVSVRRQRWWIDSLKFVQFAYISRRNIEIAFYKWFSYWNVCQSIGMVSIFLR